MRTWTVYLGVTAGLLSLSCKPIRSTSALKDIYSADAIDESRRHEANAQEVNWTIKAVSCSAILLSPTLVLSAKHCNLKAGDKLRSGWSVYTRGKIDLQVTELLESNAILDFAIAKVKFTSPMSSAQTFPPFIAMSPEELYASKGKNEGDRLFSVGFPDDKDKVWNVTYAEGQLKTQEPNRIHFNIGIINGNSGGGILKKENSMLVGIAVGGSKSFNENGWNQNSLDDPAAWNYGTPTWAIYKASQVLRDQFPDGRNKYFGGSFIPKTQLYLSLKTEGEDVQLKVATGLEVETLLLCPKATFPCSSTTSGVKSLEFSKRASGRKFYSPSELMPKKDLSLLGLVALDKNGKVIGQRKVSLIPKGASR